MMTLDDLRASQAAVLSVEQTCEVFADAQGERPDPRTVRRACENGQLPAVYVGRRIFVLREKLLAMLTADLAPLDPVASTGRRNENTAPARTPETAQRTST